MIYYGVTAILTVVVGWFMFTALRDFFVQGKKSDAFFASFQTVLFIVLVSETVRSFLTRIETLQ